MVNHAVDLNEVDDVFARQGVLFPPLSFLSLASGERQLTSLYGRKHRSSPAFLSANLQHLLRFQVGEIPALGGAVFLGESHSRAEHRNFLLDVLAERLAAAP